MIELEENTNKLHQLKNKVESLAKIISEYTTPIKIHVINFTKIQEEIYKNIPHEYLITIMRRMMYLFAKNLLTVSGFLILVILFSLMKCQRDSPKLSTLFFN